MLSGSLAKFCESAATRKKEFIADRGVMPISVGVNQDTYIKLCAAAGCVVKQLHGMAIIVHWGRVTNV